jgi:hypothetical protein
MVVPALALDVGAGGVDIIDLDGQVTETGAHLVARHTPVVGELDHRVVAFVAVANEGQGGSARLLRDFPLPPILPALHSEIFALFHFVKLARIALNGDEPVVNPLFKPRLH